MVYPVYPYQIVLNMVNITTLFHICTHHFASFDTTRTTDFSFGTSDIAQEEEVLRPEVGKPRAQKLWKQWEE